MFIWESLCFVSSSSSSTHAICLCLYSTLKALHSAAAFSYPLIAFQFEEELELFSDGGEGGSFMFLVPLVLEILELGLLVSLSPYILLAGLARKCKIKNKRKLLLLHNVQAQ